MLRANGEVAEAEAIFREDHRSEITASSRFGSQLLVRVQTVLTHCNAAALPPPDTARTGESVRQSSRESRSRVRDETRRTPGRAAHRVGAAAGRDHVTLITTACRSFFFSRRNSDA